MFKGFAIEMVIAELDCTCTGNWATKTAVKYMHPFSISLIYNYTSVLVNAGFSDLTNEIHSLPLKIWLRKVLRKY